MAEGLENSRTIFVTNQLFIHLFTQQMLIEIYYVLDAVLGIVKTSVNKNRPCPPQKATLPPWTLLSREPDV